MRSILSLSFAALCFASLPLTASAQTPGEADQNIVAEFRASAPAPTPMVRIDTRSLTENIANSVVNDGAEQALEPKGWDTSLGFYSTGRSELDKIIVDSGMRHGVDPRLIASVMHQESRFNAVATSYKGACGYMQLMPATAQRFGVRDIYNPQQNIDAGARYLRFLLDLFHNDVSLALAGYNAGEYRVIRGGYRVPQIRETQDYVRLITARYYRNASSMPGARKRYTVTMGESAMDETQREAIQRAARVTTDDRGGEMLAGY